MKERDDMLFAAVWRFLLLAVHRYEGGSAGEIFTVMTIVMLDRAGHNPSVADLVSLTGLSKSNVARYISDQIQQGNLMEQIDPEDRRRRILFPTEKAKQEQELITSKISTASELIDGDDRYGDLLRYAHGAA